MTVKKQKEYYHAPFSNLLQVKQALITILKYPLEVIQIATRASY